MRQFFWGILLGVILTLGIIAYLEFTQVEEGGITPMMIPMVSPLVSNIIAPAITFIRSYSREPEMNSSDQAEGELARVVAVIDGDTIDVLINWQRYRVRYIGMNTPESDEECYREATAANSALVNLKRVLLVKDKSDVDRYGRLLRNVYVGENFVGQELVTQGWAEAVLYNPDDRHFEEFKILEEEAAQAGRGCHPSNIFQDGNANR